MNSVWDFFIIKPNKCVNFPNLLRHETLRVSGSYSVPHKGFIHCTLSFRAGPSWPCSKAVFKPVWYIEVPSVQWINSWWWAEKLPETCRVSCRSKFGKLVHLVGFIIKKSVTMHGHMNVKKKGCEIVWWNQLAKEKVHTGGLLWTRLWAFMYFNVRVFINLRWRTPDPWRCYFFNEYGVKLFLHVFRGW
jgi:hypothetical protein